MTNNVHVYVNSKHFKHTLSPNMLFDLELFGKQVFTLKGFKLAHREYDDFDKWALKRENLSVVSDHVDSNQPTHLHRLARILKVCV